MSIHKVNKLQYWNQLTHDSWLELYMDTDHGHTEEQIQLRLNGARKHSLLRDFVYGAIDGTITTFAIISGVAGAGMSQSVIVTLGLANVLADGFSMAASNYVATRSEQQNHRHLRATELRHIEEYPKGERNELKAILRENGLAGSDLCQALNIITRHKKMWINLMLSGEYGVSPYEPRPGAAAVATFVAFVACGALPLLSFISGLGNAYELSIAITLLTFFIIGALKARWGTETWFTSAILTTSIGAIAAGIAYGAGKFVSSL